MDQQLRGSSKHEVLSAVHSVHHARLGNPLTPVCPLFLQLADGGAQRDEEALGARKLSLRIYRWDSSIR